MQVKLLYRRLLKSGEHDWYMLIKTEPYFFSGRPFTVRPTKRQLRKAKRTHRNFYRGYDMNISDTRGKWFKIVKDAEELQDKFPELKKDTIIKVIGTTEDGYGDHGIIEVMLNTGEKLCIYDRDTSLWCFWESNSIDELEEIDQVVCVGEFEGERISYALAKLAGQENNDGYEGNLMQAAAEYIEYLERRLS